MNSKNADNIRTEKRDCQKNWLDLLSFSSFNNIQCTDYLPNFQTSLVLLVQISILLSYEGFPHSSVGKEAAYNAGDLSLIPELGRSSGEENGNRLQYSHLENPMDRGAWKATVHGIAKSWTQLSN